MTTSTQYRLRISATLIATLSTCFLMSACHTKSVGAAHTNTALPSAAVTSAAPQTTPPAASPSDSAAPDDTATASAAATATAGAAVPGGCLISPREASTAFGHDAGAGSGNASTCTYQTAGGILSVFATSYGDNAMTAYTTQRQAGTALPGFHDINGVGDHAYINLDDPMSLIELIKGSTVVIIQLGISPVPPASVLTTLGQAAAGRI